MLAPLLLAAALAADPTPRDAADAPPLRSPSEAREALLGQPRAFFADFEDGGLDGQLPGGGEADLKPTDWNAWSVTQQDGNGVLALNVRKSDYQPPVRSPHNIALIDELSLAEAVIDVDVQSTITDYGHRDLCLFFGYRDPSHFYYVHLGKQADPHANQIFVVNGEPRRAISATTTDGTPWTDDWHHVRVVRFPDAGLIHVYFDDMTTPAMTASDRTFTSGQVGVGSFDDSGAFDNLAVYGTPAE